ncbi:MAG TPA: imidazole glycerol phosphate synthase subunit HisH [Acidisarcina sp.]|nr:imidazole glycerol phosphate synthase subunit HisH [Acidisarcina sp.]
MIAVIDYRAGNLTSVMKALSALHAGATVTADPDEVRKASKVILPGVGHFAATRLLQEQGLSEAVRDSIARGVPFLGICVGLQWLFEGSTEAPDDKGLGIFSGMCERFPAGAKVPHVGWNSISVRPGSRLMAQINEGEFVYYTHSYRAPVIKDTVAVTEYGEPFTGAVERDNVMGVQFHPEKSGTAGMRILKNFVEL